MIFGSVYVLSGLLITVAGRRTWKLKRDKRPARESRTDPVMGSGTPETGNEADAPQQQVPDD